MKPRYIYASVTFILSVLFGVMFAIVPFGADDLWYLENSTGDFGSWERLVTTFETCLDHTRWDTARFSNLITAPFLSVIPQWITGVISGFAIWIIFLSGPAITRSGWISLCSAAWVGTVTFVFPWINYLFLVVYASNYTWALALGLIFIYIFFRRPDFHGYKLVLACVVAYFVGWWHEGQSVPLIIALSVYLLCLRQRPEKKQILLLACLALGIMTLLSMPALWNRVADNKHILFSGSWRNSLFILVTYGCLFYLFCGVVCYLLCRKKYRKLLKENRKLTAIICAILVFDILTCFIVIRYYNGPRISLFMQTFSILGVMLIAGRFWGSPVWLKYCAFSLISLAALINLCVSIPIQKRMTREFEVGYALAQQAKAQGKDFVFCDFTPLSLGLDLYKPSYLVMNTYWGFGCTFVVPKAYEDFSLVHSDYRECNTPGLFLYENNLVAHGFEPSPYMVIEVETEDGGHRAGRVSLYWFVTEEGDTCHAIVPLFLKKDEKIINASIR